MKYASPVAFRNALEARLKTQQTDAVGLSRLRKRIVFERLLARIHAVAPDRWVLKGGFALELRLGLQARTTKDVDVDWTLDEPAVTELLLDAADPDLGTGASDRAAPGREAPRLYPTLRRKRPVIPRQGPRRHHRHRPDDTHRR